MTAPRRTGRRVDWIYLQPRDRIVLEKVEPCETYPDGCDEAFVEILGEDGDEADNGVWMVEQRWPEPTDDGLSEVPEDFQQSYELWEEGT